MRRPGHDTAAPARHAVLGIGLVLLCAWVGVAGADDETLQADALVRWGDDAPQPAIAALKALAAKSVRPLEATRRLGALDIGLVAARNGLDDEVQRQFDLLQTLSGEGDSLALPASHLVRAEQDRMAGHFTEAYDEAAAAAGGFEAPCRGTGTPPPGCDLPDWWRALELMEFSAERQGRQVLALAQARSMLDVARRAGDPAREALSLGQQALLIDGDDSAGAARSMARARQLVAADGSPWLAVRIGSLAAMLHLRHRQYALERQDFESSLAIAEAAGLTRLALRTRANLTDVLVAEGRPAAALAQIARAPPLAQHRQDRVTERVLRHNALLAELALGRVAQARADLPQLLALWDQAAGKGQLADALRELADALGRAGDQADAIALYHREQTLMHEIRATNRSAAEAEMRTKYDRDAQKRRIELVARDNELKSIEIGNEALQSRLWMIAGFALALLGVLAMLMYGRMRELNRDLLRREALLRANGARDALTGLANRRQFREVTQAGRGALDFRGALLMVDVDHFKRINDVHGHAAGDGVLVEVARRLAAGVRDADLVARWGGEEFLVFAPRIEGPELDGLAERVRVAIGGEPVRLEDGRLLPVTVSIGYACFPLPGGAVPVAWEQAINLADLSLYTAKNHGRNCAVGIVRAVAATPEALRAIETDLVGAGEAGVVTLKVTPEAAPGPLRPLPA